MQSVLRALGVLASTSGVSAERQTFMDLVQHFTPRFPAALCSHDTAAVGRTKTVHHNRNRYHQPNYSTDAGRGANRVLQACQLAELQT